MSTIDHRTSGLTRRAFIGGAAAVAGALALAGCGNTKQDGSSAAGDAEQADAASEEEIAPAAGEPTKGGTFRFYLTNPVGIEPFHAEENMGVEVMYNLFMPLCEYDYEKGEVVPAAAESWEVNDAADEFTFHLRQDGKFHNGNPVRAQDFKYSWERLCRADFKPAPSALGYKVAQVAGADEMMAGEADELDIECPDDYTLVVHLKAPFADFPFVVCERALCPVPEGCTDTEEDFQAFRVAPIGNGPFMMDGEWVDGQYIQLKPFEDYWGDKPLVDGVSFQIYTDDQTAWTEFQAGNLDFTIIPSGLFNEAKQTYGESSDGYTVNPGEQALFGDEDSIYYLICNNNDEVMDNKDVRIGISYAIDRQAICDTVLQGTRSPATNMITPGVPGYEDGAWSYAPATRDLEKAAEYFDKAGYPADDERRPWHLPYPVLQQRRLQRGHHADDPGRPAGVRRDRRAQHAGVGRLHRRAAVGRLPDRPSGLGHPGALHGRHPAAALLHRLGRQQRVLQQHRLRRRHRRRPLDHRRRGAHRGLPGGQRHRRRGLPGDPDVLLPPHLRWLGAREQLLLHPRDLRPHGQVLAERVAARHPGPASRPPAPSA